MGRLTANQPAVVVFRSHFPRRARLIADMLDARGFAVEIRDSDDGEPVVAVANSHANRARELLMCYGLSTETN
ncbi:MAG: hypothetical protein VX663_05400 [Pseudomonadota bacterium]|nr:hypothetical protein [Pseudomonadota bacterium]